MASKSSEFIAIYGRRRVGKTFLVRELLGDNFAFYVTGMDNVSMQTTYGVKANAYSSHVQSQLTNKD